MTQDPELFSFVVLEAIGQTAAGAGERIDLAQIARDLGLESVLATAEYLAAASLVDLSEADGTVTAGLTEAGEAVRKAAATTRANPVRRAEALGQAARGRARTAPRRGITAMESRHRFSRRSGGCRAEITRGKSFY
ncbi:hypothetical protein [Catenulispora acidiphila]|uniref:hypothetical protein n=1 Tax=Catenulispora acidiphila TaxID=304895 RepID=UPI00117C9FE4|nr:hypothetical protein [Catenulispora acidiphila]